MTGVAAGLGHTVACTDSGDVYSWGWNADGQLGLGDDQSRGEPELVSHAQLQDVHIDQVCALLNALFCNYNERKGSDMATSMCSSMLHRFRVFSMLLDDVLHVKSCCPLLLIACSRYSACNCAKHSQDASLVSMFSTRAAVLCCSW